MKRKKNKVFKIVVGAVIINDTPAVLLLQRREDEKSFPGMWELPSGKRSFGETSIEALHREVKEETGLQVEIIRPLSVFEYVVETADEIRDTTQINFLCRLTPGSQKIKINPKEHQAAKWFTIEELHSLRNISEEVRKAALIALTAP